jgi:hypothetical protein
MTDGWIQIVTAIFFLYGVELISYVAPPRRLLLQTLFGRFRLSAEEFTLRSLAPWSLAFSTGGFRVFWGRVGVYAYQPHRVTTGKPVSWGHRYIAFAEIHQLKVVDNELWINRERFLTLASPAEARHVGSSIQRLRACPPAARGKEIDSILDASLDHQALQKELRAIRRDCLPSRLLGTALFFLIGSALVLFPTTDWAWVHWRRFVIAYALLLIAIVGEFVGKHLRLYGSDRGDRWLKVFMLIANFPSACRVAELLSRDRLVAFHFLALARALGSRHQFLAEARAALLDLRHPSPLQAPDQRVAIEETLVEHRGRADRALCGMLVEAGVDVAALVSPPEPSAPDSFGYCPRCHEEYRVPAGECSECGVTIQAFSH